MIVKNSPSISLYPEHWHSSVIQSHNLSSVSTIFKHPYYFQVPEKLLKFHVSFCQQYLYTIFGPSEATIIAKGSVRSRSAKIKLQNQTMHCKLQIAELIFWDYLPRVPNYHKCQIVRCWIKASLPYNNCIDMNQLKIKQTSISAVKTAQTKKLTAY
jgi:hypothetical protein